MQLLMRLTWHNRFFRESNRILLIAFYEKTKQKKKKKNKQKDTVYLTYIFMKKI